MKKFKHLRLAFLTFFFVHSTYSQTTCTPGGTVLASISGTTNLCPAPPPFVTILAYEVCATGVMTDTCGGNATRYYFINIGGSLNVKAFKSTFIQVKSGGKLNIIGGANFITVEVEPAAILTGLPPSTLNPCPFIGPPNGATCYVNTINSYESKSKNTSVYPNPFIDKIIIASEKHTTIKVFNSLGQVISEFKTENENTELDLNEIPNGIYFVRIGSTTKKLIKE